MKSKMMMKTLAAAVVLSAGCYTGMDDADVEALEREDEIQEIVDNLLAAGYPEEEIGVLVDGTVYVGSDALVSLEASREMAGLDKEGNPIDDFRQYHTNNLVDASVTKICVNPTAGFAGNANLSAALDQAISRYNAQNLGFTMERNGSGCSANISANMDNSGGGVAGFPAGGLPYTSITIGQTVGSYGVAVASHVIAHELGHCIGFRHTDYFNRSISCGGAATNEGDGGVGAVHIPGTPTNVGVTADTSVMNSCFSLESTGVWTTSDVTALQYLYGGGGYVPPEWSNIFTQGSLSAAQNVETQYGPFDATGLDAIRFQIAGGTGDADLYVRHGAAPTTGTYDCRPYLGGNNETCEFNPSQDGNYYVMVRAYSAYSGVTLTVDGVGAGEPPPPAEDCDNGADDDGDGSTDCADSDCAADPVCEAPASWTQLSSTNFESGWGIWSDGGTDSRRLSNSAYAHGGSWSLEVRDDTASSKFTSSSFNLGSYDELQVDFWFYARSMENGERFFVELWNGASWVTIATAVRGTDFNNNVLYHATVEVDDTQVGFSNAAQLRFRNDGSADDDTVNYDDIVISAR